MFQCKRVYQDIEHSDGYRVLVDRLWPRGISKTGLVLDGWLKNLAPSTALRRAFHHQQLDYAAFSQAYLQELSESDPQYWQPLLEYARRGTVTLLYSSRDQQHNHARLLKAFLMQQLT